MADYERLLNQGAHLRIGAEVLAGNYRPAPPAEGWLNKADGRKKRVFRYPPPDELLFRVVNRLLQPAAMGAASPWCRSFLPGGGARSAFRAVLADRAAQDRAVLRLDVRDYFNSIDVADLLGRLPEPFTRGAVGTLLATALLDPRVERGGSVVDGGRKGIMAGTPIAPLLATLYLRELDHEVAPRSAAYARYSDDILILAPPDELGDVERLVRRRLAERGLDINEGKSLVAAPGQPWDFLGFRYHQATIGLAPITEHKLKARTTRLARRLLRWRERSGIPAERVVPAFVRRLNRRVYGVPTERAEFSWATWFLPMLSGPAGLQRLDEHVQR
ncbi:MAG: reverse transcriptase domain-containing protein, partial [Actinomycetota bacterium]|nr:reverse transcriptase domain-containing protein [Actinomycetota bacterium]